MMDKQILLDAFDKYGNPRMHLLSKDQHRIPGVKIANDDILSHMQPDMREFWNDLTIETDIYGYLLTNILGAGEMYGSNLNGDIFYAYPKEEHPTKGLRRYYKTFEHGHVFLNHDNKDPKTSVGKVLFASWNPIMMRVELLEAIEKDEPRGLKILQRVERGEFPKVSMGCFLAGTLVTMSDGTRKPIEDIQIGEEVITHLGRARKVIETHSRPYNGLIYSFKPEAHETIRTTEEHPFLCVIRDSVKEDTTRWIKDGSIEPAWVHAKCITNELLLEPIVTDVITPDYADRSFARLLGYYLAEGHVLRNKNKEIFGIELSTHCDDPIHQEIDSLCSAFGTRNAPVITNRPQSKYASSITIFDKRLANLCYEHGGAYAKNKKLSKDVMLWHPEVQRELLGAYINGDGCGTDKGAVQISTASTNLAWQWISLLPRLGILASISCLEHKAGSGFSRYNTYEWVIHIGKQWAQDLTDVCAKIWPSERIIPKNSRLIKDDYILTPIRESSSLILNTTVYNIEVEEDESYLVAGLAVHNCRVPFDVCTICRNVARTRDEYCSHLKHDINKILPTGELVAAINDYPRFFDSSKVFVEADRSSGTLAKVAGKVIVEMPKKESTIEKQVTDNQVEDKSIKENPREVELGKEVDSLDSILPPEILKMLSDFPMPDIMGTFNDLGMKVKPQEFIFIRISKAGGPGEKMIEKNISIEPDVDKAEDKVAFVSGKNFNTKIASILEPFIASRSMYPYALSLRAKKHSIFKTVPKECEYIKNAALEKEYATYIKTAVNIRPTAMMYTINNHPEYFNNLHQSNPLDKTANFFTVKELEKCKAALYGALHNF